MGGETFISEKYQGWIILALLTGIGSGNKKKGRAIEK